MRNEHMDVVACHVVALGFVHQGRKLQVSAQASMLSDCAASPRMRRCFLRSAMGIHASGELESPVPANLPPWQAGAGPSEPLEKTATWRLIGHLAMLLIYAAFASFGHKMNPFRESLAIS